VLCPPAFGRLLSPPAEPAAEYLRRTPDTSPARTPVLPWRQVAAYQDRGDRVKTGVVQPVDASDLALSGGKRPGFVETFPGPLEAVAGDFLSGVHPRGVPSRAAKTPGTCPAPVQP